MPLQTRGGLRKLTVEMPMNRTECTARITDNKMQILCKPPVRCLKEQQILPPTPTSPASPVETIGTTAQGTLRNVLLVHLHTLALSRIRNGAIIM